MYIINTQEKFDELCLKLMSEKIIGIDTEFCRRKTYYAKLSLIQIATPSEQAIIDVLSDINIGQFNQILQNEDICKVLHAPDQDFDIFLHIFKQLPKNVFDTQLAAHLIGMGDMNSYARLCKDLLNVNLDKSLQKENWLQRPLNKQFLNYAIKDVEYLIPLYRVLSGAIRGRNLWENYQQRIQKILSPESYKLNMDRLLKKTGVFERNDKFKKIFCELVLFREECAKQLDVPRAYCITDEQLIQLAEKLPTNNEQLAKMNISSGMVLKSPFRNRLFELCLGIKDLI